MKKMITILGFLFLLNLPLFAQEPCKRHIETAGKFSYCPPAGGVTQDSSGKFNELLGKPPEAAFIWHLNFGDEVTTISNSEFLAAGIKLIFSGEVDKNVKDTKLIYWKDFTTSTNIGGSKLIFESVLVKNGSSLITIQYVFDLPGRKLVMTATTTAANKESADKLFDAVAKSIQIVH